MPFSLSQRIDLAKTYEDKLSDKSGYSSWLNRGSGILPLPSNSRSNDSNVLKAQPARNPRFVRQLFDMERAKKEAKGECYNCYEKWHRNHKCAVLHILDLEDEDDAIAAQQLIPCDEENNCYHQYGQPAISLHALWGQSNPRALRTFRMEESLSGKKIQLMINSGSSHNYIQE
ncbi:uncharacterized protein [Rutidosis leptorrhynchoides]|uniref:uncharacterized protein n=1 Tax=Rutidosis leptorrhynchoides TaxID=125765 RepID=UPI003A99DA97